MDLKYLLLLLAFVGRFPAVEFRSASKTGRLFKSSSGSYGSKIRSSSGGQFSGLLRSGNTKSILMGAAGAFAAYQVGKGVYKLGRNSARKEMYGRPYYFGDRYYSRPSNRRICNASLAGNDFGQFEYEDGGEIETVYFECDLSGEECCDWDCCEASSGNLQWWQIFLIVVASIGILFSVMYFCAQCVDDSDGGIRGSMENVKQNGNQSDEYQMPTRNEQSVYPNAYTSPYPTPYPQQQPPPYNPEPYGDEGPAQPNKAYPQTKHC